MDSQTIQNITAICTSLFTAVTAGLLLWYTCETQKLRVATQALLKESQTQNEHSMFPILTLSVEDFQDATTQQRIIVRNVGNGPAFNAHTAIDGKTYGVTFEAGHSPFLAAGETQPVRILATWGGSKEDIGTLRGLTGYLQRLSPQASVPATISYSSTTNKKHAVRMTIASSPFTMIFEGLSSQSG